jgi:TonB-linked SusC/RagA family outer membrane protein
MKVLYLMICLLLAGEVNAQYLLRGRVVAKDNQVAVAGTSVALMDGKGIVLKKQQTDAGGEFNLSVAAGTYTLDIYYMGYQRQQLKITVPQRESLTVVLHPVATELQEVSVLSNGYQRLAKGKATGSFVQLDSAILNRRVSPDILSRLADVTPGLIFNRNRGSEENDISIRGRSTLFANDQPLIVLDNFPYEGNLNAVNPNDVESITVLKDAAAAAIWGARSGNGVIVITTRSGKYGQKNRISFNTNFTYGARPDLFYNSRMSTSDFIDMEKKLFAAGFYATAEQSDNRQALTPVVELLIAARDGTITAQHANAQIEQFRGYDIRNDFTKYIYQNSQAQQYALQLSGGSAQQKYLVSVGYDKGLSSLVGNGTNRLSLRGSNTYSFAQGKAELGTEVYFIKSNTQTNNAGTSYITTGNTAIYPYARLVDDFGNPVNVPHDYRQGFVDAAPGKGLLDWNYNPIREIAVADNQSVYTDLRLNSRLKYRILPGLDAEVLYQYTRNSTVAKNIQGLESYYTRNLINVYTQVNADGSLWRGVPIGAIQDLTTGLATGNSIRGQLNYGRQWGSDHEVNAIGGYEIRSQESTVNTSRLYGFSPLNVTNAAVDYLTLYKSYPNIGNTSLRVPFMDQEKDYNDRFISWYANAAYTFKERYTLSASARLDRSNIFGVRTNQKGVPLYSAGLSWNVAREGFYHWDGLPLLKIRATFGYNGNVDRSLSAVTTATYTSGTGTILGLPYASITNPPNPDLRWERVKIYNLGLDFSLRNKLLSGSVDIFQKEGIDLIGNTNMPTSSGVRTFRGNTANTSGKGIDLVLNSSIGRGELIWNPALIFSYAVEKVKRYGVKAPASSYLGGGEYELYPFEGKPLASVFSYPWAGLDPATGEPRIYFRGEITKDFNKVAQQATAADLLYNGPAKPRVFGALRNTLQYKNFSLSVNISYRLGYYFQRASVQNYLVLSGVITHGDYAKRWQKPGDELVTAVPALPAVRNANQDKLYMYSSALVEKGDHVRLQDVNLGYTLNTSDKQKLPFSVIRFYVYANNLGLLWAANKQGLDPDYQLLKPVKTISAGLKVDF